MSGLDLIVIGAGELGCRVAHRWKKLNQDAKVFLKTNSEKTERDAIWQAAGFETFSNEKERSVKAPYVVFCAPPTGNANYASDVAAALKSHWEVAVERRCFVFTSSGGVYAENSGGSIDENSEVKHSEWNDRILGAERAVLEEGGCVLRLGGLYTKNRGAHNYWLSNKDSYPSNPNGLINLIHYDDAAECVIAAFGKMPRKQVFLVSDGVPISRVDICKGALANPDYQDKKEPKFEGDPSLVDGKKYNAKKAREELGFQTEFRDFVSFMAEDYKTEKLCDLLIK